MPSTSTTLRIPLAAALRHPGNARPMTQAVALEGLSGVAAEVEASAPVLIDVMLERSRFEQFCSAEVAASV